MLQNTVAHNVLSILLLCTSISLSQTQELSFEKAIEMALQNNDKVLQYKEKLIQKKYEKRSARGNLLPSVSLSAGYTHLDDPLTIDLEPIREAMISLQARNQVSLASMASQIKGGPAIDNPLTPAYQSIYQQAYGAFDQALPNFIDTLKEQNYPSAVITAVQPLFTGGKIRSAIRAAEIEKTTTSYELKKIEQDVVMETADYYIATILMRDIVKVRRDVLSAMEIHKERAEKLYAQGIIAKYHLLRAEVAVSEANRNLYLDQNRYEVARIALRKCINSESNISDPTDSLVYHPIEDTLDKFLDNSEKDQPVFSIIKCKKDLANQKVAVQKSAFLPSVAAFGKFELFPDYLSALEPQWAAGVMLNLTLFNGFKNINNLQSSRHLISELEKLESGTRDDIRLWINKAYRDMRSNEKLFLLLESDIKLAEENLRQCKSRFENGYGTSLEVIDAQLVLEKNKIDRLVTLHDYYKSYIDLSTATGSREQILRIFR